MERPSKRIKFEAEFKKDMICIVCREFKWEFDLGVSMHTCGNSVCQLCWVRMEFAPCPLCRSEKGKLIQICSSKIYAPSDICTDCGLKIKSSNHQTQCAITRSWDIKNSIKHWNLDFCDKIPSKDSLKIRALALSPHHFILFRGSQVAVVQSIWAGDIKNMKTVPPFLVQVKLCPEPTLPDMYWFERFATPPRFATYTLHDLQYAVRKWGVIFSSLTQSNFLLRRPEAIAGIVMTPRKVLLLRIDDTKQVQAFCIVVPKPGTYQSSPIRMQSTILSGTRGLHFRCLVPAYSIQLPETHLSAPPDLWQDIRIKFEDGDFIYD